MAVRFSELPAPWVLNTAHSARDRVVATDGRPARIGLRGQLLLERADSLAGVRIGGRGIPGVAGVPLSLDPKQCKRKTDLFLRDRVFALVADDGAVCLRLPTDIGDDLVENGLCVRAGKNLLTWPVENEHMLEIAWRILLHAYWEVTGTPARHARRLWSEWVINH